MFHEDSCCETVFQKIDKSKFRKMFSVCYFVAVYNLFLDISVRFFMTSQMRCKTGAFYSFPILAFLNFPASRSFSSNMPSNNILNYSQNWLRPTHKNLDPKIWFIHRPDFIGFIISTLLLPQPTPLTPCLCCWLAVTYQSCKKYNRPVYVFPQV